MNTATTVPRTVRLNGRALATALILALGMIAIVCFAVSWATMMVQFARTSGIQRTPEQLIFTPDGDPLVRFYSAMGEYRYRDLEGTPVANALAIWPENSLVRPIDQEIDTSPGLAAFNDGQDPATFWYFIKNCDQIGRGYFVAFNPMERNVVGYLGTNGFQSFRPRIDEQFDIARSAVPVVAANRYSDDAVPTGYGFGDDPLGYLVTLISDDRAFVVDLGARTITPVGDNRGVISAQRLGVHKTVERHGRQVVDSSLSDKIALRMTDRIVVHDIETGTSKQWNLPEFVANAAFDFMFLENGRLIAAVSEPDLPWDATRTLTVYQFEPDGTIVSEVKVHLRTSGEMMLGMFDIPRLSGAPLLEVLADLVAMPLSVILWGNHESYGAALAEILPMSWPWLLLGAVYAAIAIGLGVWHARQHSVRLTWPWFGLFLLLGIPGYLGYRWHRRWPPLEIPALPTRNSTEIVAA